MKAECVDSKDAPEGYYAVAESADCCCAGCEMVDNGDSSVYGINPVEFWKTHERAGE